MKATLILLFKGEMVGRESISSTAALRPQEHLMPPQRSPSAPQTPWFYAFSRWLPAGARAALPAVALTGCNTEDAKFAGLAVMTLGLLAFIAARRPQSFESRDVNQLPQPQGLKLPEAIRLLEQCLAGDESAKTQCGQAWADLTAEEKTEAIASLGENSISGPSAPTPPRGDAILLVDDEPFIMHIPKILVRAGFQKVLVAKSGPAALVFLGKNPDVGAVITDLNMPCMKGSDLSRILRSRYPRLPIILWSSTTMPPVDVEGITLLSKDISADGLVKHLKSLII